MMKIKKVSTFLGNCLIIEKESKQVEIMELQFKSMLSKVHKQAKIYGDFPHGGFSYDRDEKILCIYHDEDRSEHEVYLNENDMLEILESI